MKNVLKNYTPEALFRFFEEISDIPRGSGNEKGIADYLERFAHERDLYCKRDAFNNVYIRKEASPGLENKPSVLFQAHTDMVCVSKDGVLHDFLTEPIELLTDDKYIFANGTSLGADDGAGVATMLALIDSQTFPMPMTEYLFTATEETGMDGAFGFDYSEIRSGLIVNLDSEEEFNACIGCAGGIHAKAVIPAERVRTEGKICKIEISGLSGGHSGIDIDLGRRSALKLLALCLDRIYKIYPFHVVSLDGGSKDNVIPSDAAVTVAFVDNAEAKRAKSALPEIKKELIGILTKEDRRCFSLKFSSVGNTASCEENTVSESEFSDITGVGMLSLKSTSALISALMLSPQGVTDRYFGKTQGVAGSVNLGIVKTEKDVCSFSYLIRSGVPFYSEKTFSEIERLMHLCGGYAEIKGRYPGWESKEGESLQKLYAKTVKELYGRDVTFSRVHAGLECGIIYERLKALGNAPEIISIGPNNLSIHTACEKLETASLVRLYETVTDMLKTL